MYFKQFYLGCLAHASYLIGSHGEAVVVDPQRDVEQYLDEAAAQNLRILYVIETHVHADFVSGHAELAKRTGAQIVFGARAALAFPHRAVADGDVLTIGAVELRFFETPGHTPESICVVASDGDCPDEPAKVLTGDTLFIGDVGRPDLIGAKGFTAPEMAAMLYESLHGKLMELDDAVEVYPGHGAGSLCGRNLSTDTSSTIGAQRARNYALQPMPKAEFVALMTAGLPEVPAYFASDVALNRAGAPALDELPRPAALSPAALSDAVHDGALLLDVRPSEAYGPKHVAGSLNIGLDGQFASWAGSLVPLTRPIVLIAADEDAVREALVRLARVGFASIRGYLAGGIDAWVADGRPVAETRQLSPDDLAHVVADAPSHVTVLDVRRPGEVAAGKCPGALAIPLSELERRIAELDPARETIIVCGSGYRSSIAGSLLESYGFAHVANVDGGMTGYGEAGHPTVVTESAA